MDRIGNYLRSLSEASTMANLVIKNADELRDDDVEARAAARRAARETPVLRAVLRLFAESGGPVSVAAVAASLASADEPDVAKTLAILDAEDLLVLRSDIIDLAYPFSTSPTPFVVRRADGRDRTARAGVEINATSAHAGGPQPPHCAPPFEAVRSGHRPTSSRWRVVPVGFSRIQVACRPRCAAET